MIFPELKSITSPDLEYGHLPPNSDNCQIFIEVEIGPKDQEGADIFSFTAITLQALSSQTEHRWGRGYLVMDTFSWQLVELAIGRLLSHCSGQTWNEVAIKLNQELHWEFENYEP